jgi:hypothetical protein
LAVEGVMQRVTRTLLAVAAMAMVAACGNGSSPSAPSEVIEPSNAPKADITVTVGFDALQGPSLEPGYTQYVRFTASMSEAAGLGAHLNFVRGDFYKDQALVDRYEFTGVQLVEETGSNRLEAGSARSFVVVLRWNAPCDLIRTTFYFTDDEGHDHHLVGNITATSTAVAASPDDESDPERL